jgi:hypothetical protein
MLSIFSRVRFFQLPQQWMKIGLIVGAGFINSCASTYQHPQLTLIPESEYFSKIEKSTRKQQIYDGFQQILEIQGTLLKTDVALAYVDHQARMFQWTPENYNTEKEKKSGELKKQTELFVSFFVPERKHDDLHKTKTLWKIFLDVNGKRYEGKATKIKAVLAEVMASYPHHNRWSTPYKIIFPAPVSEVDTHEAKITFTGPVSSVTLTYDL